MIVLLLLLLQMLQVSRFVLTCALDRPEAAQGQPLRRRSPVNGSLLHRRPNSARWQPISIRVQIQSLTLLLRTRYA